MTDTQTTEKMTAISEIHLVLTAARAMVAENPTIAVQCRGANHEAEGGVHEIALVAGAKAIRKLLRDAQQTVLEYLASYAIGDEDQVVAVAILDFVKQALAMIDRPADDCTAMNYRRMSTSECIQKAWALSKVAFRDAAQKFDALDAIPVISNTEASIALNRALADLRQQAVNPETAAKICKAIVCQFAGPNGKSHQIPQRKRLAFLEALQTAKTTSLVLNEW